MRGFQLRQRGQHPWHMTRDIRPEPGELAGDPSPAGGGRTHLQCRSVAERADPSPAPLVWAINPVVTSDRREREGRLPGDRRAQSYSGLGRRGPSRRVPADSSQHSARGRLANEQYPHSGETVKRSGQGGPRAHKRMVERGPASAPTRMRRHRAHTMDPTVRHPIVGASLSGRLVGSPSRTQTDSGSGQSEAQPSTHTFRAANKLRRRCPNATGEALGLAGNGCAFQPRFPGKAARPPRSTTAFPR